MQRLVLIQRHPSDHDGGELRYEVKQVVDSTSPMVGEVLSREAVGDYCSSDEWQVTIKAAS